MEAPPHRPGHVGHTPQPVQPAIVGARLQGIFGSSLVRALATLRRPTALQAFPRLQSPREESTVLTMLRLERYRQTMSERQPWPVAFREGFRSETAPRSDNE